MANEDMVVVAVVARKGGSGKSTLVKALASAALAGGKSALVIDTDPQGDLTRWFARALANGLAPAGASFATVKNTAELEATIHSAYDAQDRDFVFIDTAGVGGEWTDEIAMMADHLVTPVVASYTDLEVGAQTVAWFKGLHARVPDPAKLPPHHVVLTQLSSRTTALEMKMLQDASRLFPVMETLMQHRNVYREMDAQGFLGEIVRRLKASPNPLQRGQARNYQEALVESNQLLNDILEA